MDKLRDKHIIMKFGLIFGLSVMLYNLIAFMAGVSYMVSFTNMALGFAVGVIALLITAYKIREAAGGFITFGNIFKLLMTAVILGSFLIVLNDMMINTVLDPALPVKVFEASKEKTGDMLEAFGASEELASSTREQMDSAFDREKIEERYAPLGLLHAWLMTSFMWLFPVLIISLIIKKSPQVFKR